MITASISTIRETGVSERVALARQVLARESEAISALAPHVDAAFDRAVSMILNAQGRVIVTGMGKSGLIGQKIAATLSSTGTPSFFLHPVEAGHGDMGVVSSDDVVLVISKSAASAEIAELLPAFKRLGTPIILIAGHLSGELTRHADIVLDASVECEAEDNDLVPTCSTTAALALGDALAIVLMRERGITPDDFARFHPRGALGRRLLLTVAHLMHRNEQVPLVKEGAPLKDVLVEMTRKRFGCTGVVDTKGQLRGIFTDGDLRRQIEKGGDLLSYTAAEVMTRHPKVTTEDQLAVEALAQMEDAKITVLFVVDSALLPVGIIHLHDVLSSGAA